MCGDSGLKHGLVHSVRRPVLEDVYAQVKSRSTEDAELGLSEARS